MRQSLVGLINFWRKKQPKKIALLTPSSVLSYKQLWEKAYAYAWFLKRQEASFIGIATSSQEQAIISLIAIMLCKKRFLILDASSDYFCEIIERVNLDAIITDLNLISSINKPIISIKELSKVSFDEVYSIFDYSLDMNVEIGSFLSSGTTGLPKIFARSNYSLVSEAFLWIFELQLSIKTKFYINNPISYIGSFVLLYSVLYSGGTIVLNDGQKFINSVQVKYAFYSVKTINELLNAKNGDMLQVTAKTVLTMGAPIDYDTKKRFADKFHCNVLEMWGNSEGLATLISLSDSHASKGSIGRATFTDDLFISDKNGQRLSPYTIGYISGITDNDTAATKSEIIVSDDLGYRDKDEYFYLVGREKNVILFSNNTYFSTILFENHIKEFCKVSDCVVTISSDRVHINVFYVALSPINIKRICQEYIDSFSENISLGQIVKLDVIPYNKNGKINYITLDSYLD